MRRLVLKLSFVLLAAFLPLLATAAPAHGLSNAETDFLSRINGLRASKGLAPLAIDASLTSFAAGWTAHMASTGQLAHNPALGSAPGNWTVVGTA